MLLEEERHPRQVGLVEEEEEAEESGVFRDFWEGIPELDGKAQAWV